MEVLTAFCDFEGATWLLFNPNVAPLIYYSHLPIIVISILLAFFILKQNKKSLPNQILFFMLLPFGLWVFLDSIFWASNRSDVIMLVWSIILLIEPLVYMAGLYLLYVLVEKKDLGFRAKLLLSLLCVPLIVFVPTIYGLSSFDLGTCLSVEGPIALYYTYAVEALMVLIIIAYTIYKLVRPAGSSRKEVLSLSAGTILFLLAFAWGNITGSFTENWQLGQFGLFGMPLFAGFLAYSIVKFHTFNIKLLAAQALVVALWFLVPSLLFIRTIDNVRIVVGITSILIFILGVYLIRSVKREVEQRERIEVLAKDLESANEQLKVLDQARAEFISIASHQLRTPPATVKWYLSALLAGDYGKVPAGLNESLKKAQNTNNHLISLIEDMLNVSRIERGKMEFLFAPTNIEELAKFASDQLIPMASDKKLKLVYIPPKTPLPEITADKEKLRQVMNNLIDNALKYTKAGTVEVRLMQKGDEIHFYVKDSGKGIAAAEKNSIFQKFSRGKESIKQSAGLGLGLYVAKIIIEQHKGKIWAESQGEGKGSTFCFSLPINSGLKETTLVDLAQQK